MLLKNLNNFCLSLSPSIKFYFKFEPLEKKKFVFAIENSLRKIEILNFMSAKEWEKKGKKTKRKKKRKNQLKFHESAWAVKKNPSSFTHPQTLLSLSLTTIRRRNGWDGKSVNYNFFLYTRKRGKKWQEINVSMIIIIFHSFCLCLRTYLSHSFFSSPSSLLIRMLKEKERKRERKKFQFSCCYCNLAKMLKLRMNGRLFMRMIVLGVSWCV